jgi:hypothetical protein
LARASDDWDLLPPLPEIIEAVNKFTGNYFQLGFIPKLLFPERLRTQHRSVSVFFLLGVLSISARLTPALVERYGSAVRASETFMERASALAQNELYKDPSLERCQAFYLLSIAQQGSGMKHKSSVSYPAPFTARYPRFPNRKSDQHGDCNADGDPDAVTQGRNLFVAESHKGTYYPGGICAENLGTFGLETELGARCREADGTPQWMLHSQDNLHSGPRSPVLLSASDITALLPSNEKDFANARQPKSRAALEDTPPALESPALVADEGRSLFAVLIQSHYYWGAICRRAINNNKSLHPWDPAGEYAQMERRLAEWERGLPNDYRWSSLLLKGYKQEGQDLVCRIPPDSCLVVTLTGAYNRRTLG